MCQPVLVLPHLIQPLPVRSEYQIGLSVRHTMYWTGAGKSSLHPTEY